MKPFDGYHGSVNSKATARWQRSSTNYVLVALGAYAVSSHYEVRRVPITSTCRDESLGVVLFIFYNILSIV
jgi:hypothetical protein